MPSTLKVILLNYPYLQSELRGIGVQAISVGLTSDCDRVLAPDEYNLDRILAVAGFTPDWIIFVDSLARVIPAGIEASPFPLAAIYIDSVINRFWQHPLAHLFDLVLVDQAADARTLQDAGLPARWFPLAADTRIYQPVTQPRLFDISFIGNRSPTNRIKRENLLRRLSSRFRVQIFDGNPPVSAEQAALIHSRSRLALNENLFPSVNLRLFEAMASGAAVLTEEVDADLNLLFHDRKHVIIYNPDNLLKQVEYYLSHEAAREAVARAGCELVQRRHSFEVRARELLSLLLQHQPPPQLPKWVRFAALGEALVHYEAKWPGRDPSALTRAGQLLEKSISVHPTPEALINLGKLHQLAGNTTVALRCFQAAAVKSAGWRAPLYQGMLLGELNRGEESRCALTRAQTAVGTSGNAGEVLIPGTAAFHKFWGERLLEAGMEFSPGLMQFNLPMSFWNALEHLTCAARLDRSHWESVGDLLLRAGVPDQALMAYRNAGEGIPESKLRQAKRGAYEELPETEDLLPGVRRAAAYTS